MTVTQVLGGLGSWSLQLSDETPDDLRRLINFFGHVAIVDGEVDVQQTQDSLLPAARYVGVLREGARTLNPAGSGMAFWLGDEDNKGQIQARVDFDSETLADAVDLALPTPSAVVAGTIHAQPDTAQRYSGVHEYQTPRQILDMVCPIFEVEYRVNGDATLDVGTPADLYGATPAAIIKRRGAGTDLDLIGLGGEFEPGNDVYDFSTGVILLAQTLDDNTILTGEKYATGVPYSDPQGNPVQITRIISESGETIGTVERRTQLQLNRFYRAKRSVSINLADYESDAPAHVGQYVWVYDPDTGLVDPAQEVLFRGEALHPVLERVSGATWNVREGMTVAFRTHTGVWVDLTPYVVFESGSDELTIGDQSQTLTRPGSEVQDRLDTTRGSITPGPLNEVPPKAPTNLVLTTSSTLDSAGRDVPVITASWDAPTQNTDDTAFTDFAFHSVEWQWTGRPAFWQRTTSYDTTIDLPVAAGLPYNVRVRTFDSDRDASPWSATATITSADDTTAPPTPSDPLVTNYLGQLRIEWDGLTSTGGAMPADFNRVDVHVGTASGFTPSAATLVSSLPTKGVAYATATYGATRYVRLIAYDHQGNASGASGTVSGSTKQVVGTDIAGNVIDLSHVTFKDQGNLVPDGSFRIATLTAQRAAQSGWAAVTGYDGSDGMQWAPGDGNLILATGVPVTPGEQIMTRYAFFSSTGGTSTGRVWIKAIWSLSTGGTSTQYISTGGLPNLAVWSGTTPTYVTVPANAVTAEFFATVENATAGTWTVDQVEIRKVIGTVLIQDAAITTAKINDLAVNNAKIGSMEVGKLTAGTMSADVVVSGRFATALTGARVELNALGLQKRDAANALLVSITGTENLLTGIFKTALSGRRIEIGSGGATGQVSFYAPDGKLGYVRSHTESTGTEAIQFGIEVAGYTDNLWNRINYNSSAAGEYATYRSGTHEFIYDSTAPNAAGRFAVFQTSSRGNDPSDVRLDIDSGGTSNYFPIAGRFYVADRSDFSGVIRRRLDITTDYTFVVFNTGGQFGVLERQTDGTEDYRLQVTDTDVRFPFVNINQRLYIQRNDDSTGNGSPFLQLVNNHNYGVTQEWRSTSTGTFGSLHFRDATATVYVNLTASGFTPSSARATKTGIRDAGPMAALMRAARVRAYRRVGEPETAAEHMGLVVEEAPAHLRVLDHDGSPLGIDLYGYVASLHKYVQELDERWGQP